MDPRTEPRWTFTGPVKWAAVTLVLLGSVAGLGAVVWSRGPRTLVPLASVRDVPTAQRPPAGPDAAPRGSRPSPATVSAGTLNVNAATRAELELLPGIGPALAGRIIDHRTTHGPFRSMDDLDKVRGIGPKLMERLRPLVRFE